MVPAVEVPGVSVEKVARDKVNAQKYKK